MSGARRGGRRAAVAWSSLAVALLLGAALLHYAATWRAGIGEHVPSLEAGSWERLVAADHVFVVWMVDRNARALLGAPGAFFEAPACFPTPQAVALGEPLLTMGLLALPVHRLGGPVATWNAVLVLMLVVAGGGMFALVARLSDSYPAALLAALLYALHPARLADPVHPYVYDTSGTVWALFFLDRLLARGRWPDAIGVACSAGLQIGASFYGLVAGGAAALPLVAWWAWRRGLRAVPLAQGTAAVLLPALLAFWLFTPYLEQREAGTLSARTAQTFAGVASYLPGGSAFPGWLVLALTLGAWLPRERSAARCGPRAALLAGGLCAAALATAPVWQLLAPLPGFTAVRNPSVVAGGLSLALCVLAGLGCARLERRLATRHARWAALGLLVIVVLGAGWVRSRQLLARPLSPDSALLGFYRTLAERGDDGPLFEMPVHSPRAAQRVLLSSFHGRATSACLSSYQPQRRRLEALARALPDPAAVRELRSLGFATVVFHHAIGDPPSDRLPREPLRRRVAAFDREAARPAGELRPLYADPVRSAWTIRPLRAGRGDTGATK